MKNRNRKTVMVAITKATRNLVRSLAKTEQRPMGVIVERAINKYNEDGYGTAK